MTNQMVATKKKMGSSDRVIDTIGWTLNVPTSRLYPYTHLQDDLHLDAVDLMLLIIELENRFNVYLTPEQADAIETISDVSYFFRNAAA